MSSAPQTPVLLARREGHLLVAECPFCGIQHVHGAHDQATGCRHDPMRPGRVPCTCPAGTGDGHRVAHCADPASPYRQTGYVLREQAPDLIREGT